MRRASAWTRSTFSSYRRRKACASPRAASTASLGSRLWGRARWSRVKVGCQVRVADISPDWTGGTGARLEPVAITPRAWNPLRGRAPDQRGAHGRDRPMQPGGRSSRLHLHDVRGLAAATHPSPGEVRMSLRRLAAVGALALLPTLASPSEARTYSLSGDDV